jgi:hypothetical protein
VAFGLLAVAVAGCEVSLRTASPAGPNDACALALIGGVLVPNQASGLGLRDATGIVHGVVWPRGYSARREWSGITLLDRNGVVVAREGDSIQMTGGWGVEDLAYPCSDPKLTVLK